MNFKIELNETIKLRDSLELKSFAGNTKKFVAHIISGWFTSKRSDLSPEGVFKERVIDRRNNVYREKVTDAKSGRIIRDIEEDLTSHR